MTTAQFRLELPESTWIKGLSQGFPRTRFRLLTGLLLEDGALELGEFHSDDVPAVVAAFEDHPAVRKFDGLFADQDRALARYETCDTALYDFLRESSFPPEFPILVRDGWVTFDLTGPREQLRNLRDTLEASPLDYEVVSVGDTEVPADLLTTRQREVVERAVRRGYYTVPRDCTLSELAADLGIDKSTASGVLRRGEARIVSWFLSASRGSLRR